ncbi:MAG: outer membrane beta-barrel protein [Verrucomicrobiota bacterium]
MKNSLFAIAVSGLLLGHAAAGTLIPPTIKHSPSQCFYAGEFNVDLISLYADPSGDHPGGGLEDGFGGGLGLSYFHTERFGTQFRAYWWDQDSVIHSVTASAVVRFPVERYCLAPYLFGGAGGHFDSVNQVGAHAGAGLEVRLNDRWGIIADYTYTWADETEDWNLYTLGLRFTF